MDTLEKHYRDMCDIEFTIEKGRLWILQTRVGKRTAFAEWVMAHDMLDEDLIDEDTALVRVDANRLDELLKRRVNADGREGRGATDEGLNASPGRRPWRSRVHRRRGGGAGEDGAKVVLVRRETTAGRLPRDDRAQGILTAAGGTNSHAAVVARGEGIPAVCGADAIKTRHGAARAFEVNGTTVHEGEVITIDGFTATSTSARCRSRRRSWRRRARATTRRAARGSGRRSSG